jgi:hypothetical protein
MNDMAGKGSDFIKDLGEAARRNPMSAALIGMGVLWLFAGNKAGIGPSEVLQRSGMDRIPDAAKDGLNAVREGVASATGSAAGTIREAGNAGIETATRLGSEYAKMLPEPANVVESVRGNLTDLFKAQPLALGAIGLAIGAGIAAALPHTDIENAYLGDTSEALKSKAAEIAGDQIERATTLASDVVEAATEGARKEGLTMEGAKAVLHDLSGKVSRVADAAGKSLSESVK